MASKNPSQPSLDTPVKDLYLIGPALAKRFNKLGVNTLKDLFYLLPNRWEDRRLTPPSRLQPQTKVAIKGAVQSTQTIRSRRGLSLQILHIIYQNLPVQVVFYNQPYLIKTLKPGSQAVFWGKIDKDISGFRLEAAGYEIIQNGKPLIHSLKIVPIYPETKGLTNKQIRRVINFYLTKFASLLPPEFLPAFILTAQKYPSYPQAFFHLHAPTSTAQAQQAKQRFLFETLLVYQINTAVKQAQWRQKRPIFSLTAGIAAKLPSLIQKSSRLTLSPSQKDNLTTILTSMQAKKPMNRLLLGDVGSGKTLVAAGAACAAHLAGYQTILMTPTEVLAQQTYQKFTSYLPSDINISLHTQSNKKKGDDWHILIGTHALLFRSQPKTVGLVIIDEQHRFGVRQRTKSIDTDPTPHVLTMSATPIPRTLVLTLFGHLDVSYLEPLPDQIKNTTTHLLRPEHLAKAYQWIIDQVNQFDCRAFIVTPLIEDSAHETMKDIKAVTSLYRQLTLKFPAFSNFGLLHGRLKPKEKEQIINQFKTGQVKILISTSVIEVGIDIPQANIILIEGAERFGLAQLHQLRGRVGRLGQKSYCLLAPTKFTSSIYKRLKLLTRIHSGHQLAEWDLKLRGPGQIFGLAQHGFPKELFPLLNDIKLTHQAKLYAQKIAPQLSSYPNLQDYLNQVKIKDISFT
ncbi:MAG: ATP-dependent DNA helicase RecG [bacterium]|nr:ATP-dependent DNA helicase RecG [bacterium]